MKRKALVPIIVVGALLGACTFQSAPEPTPVTTVTVEPELIPQDEEAELKEQILDDVFNAQPTSAQEMMCDGYAISPEAMWQSFNQGAEDTFTHQEFDDMMERNCP